MVYRNNVPNQSSKTMKFGEDLKKTTDAPEVDQGSNFCDGATRLSDFTMSLPYCLYSKIFYSCKIVAMACNGINSFI